MSHEKYGITELEDDEIDRVEYQLRYTSYAGIVVIIFKSKEKLKDTLVKLVEKNPFFKCEILTVVRLNESLDKMELAT